MNSLSLTASVLCIAAIAGCAAEATETTESVTSEVRAELGRASFEYEGAKLTITTVTHGRALKFDAALSRDESPVRSFECFLGATAEKASTLSCGGGGSATAFVIQLQADDTATIALGESHRQWVESHPEADAVPGLGLRGMTPQPLVVGAAKGIHPKSVSMLIDETTSGLGRFPTDAKGGGYVTVTGWELVDPEVAVALKFEPMGGAAATRLNCYSSENSPEIWATGSPEGGLARPAVLAQRIKSASTWMLENCKHWDNE